MKNYGSNIKFVGEKRGTKKGARYNWIAGAHLEDTNTIFIYKYDRFWIKEPLNFIIYKVTNMIPHECIHQILWEFGEDQRGGYDIVRGHLLHKRKCSQYLRNLYYRST